MLVSTISCNDENHPANLPKVPYRFTMLLSISTNEPKLPYLARWVNPVNWGPDTEPGWVVMRIIYELNPAESI